MECEERRGLSYDNQVGALRSWEDKIAICWEKIVEGADLEVGWEETRSLV